MCACACLCVNKQNMTRSSKKLFLLKLLVNLLSPSFPERELLVHCAVENQAMKKRMGRWRRGLGGTNLAKIFMLCVNEMVGGEAAKCSQEGGVAGRVAWDSQRALLKTLRGAESPVGAGPDRRNAPVILLPQEQSRGKRSNVSLPRDMRSQRAD